MEKRLALVGRPNVGKSTLFNLLRAQGAAAALVHDAPGTTRDVRTTAGEFFGLTFTLLDTAGIEQGRGGQIEMNSKRNAARGNKSNEPTTLSDKTPQFLATTLNRLAIEALQTADVLLFVIDGGAGVLPDDQSLARQLHKLGKTVLPILNKADLSGAEDMAPEVEALGFGAPVIMATAHSQGLSDLHDRLTVMLSDAPTPSSEAAVPAKAGTTTALTSSSPSHLLTSAATSPATPRAGIVQPLPDLDAFFEEITSDPLDDTSETENDPENPQNDTSDPTKSPEITETTSSFKPGEPIKLAFVGRPNVGKSTLVNTLLQNDKMLTGPIAGLTREAIAHTFMWRKQPYVLVDTPGLRKKANITSKLEELSVLQTLQAIEAADVVILLVDASDYSISSGTWMVFEQQDAKIAAAILNQNKPLVICLTKWDEVHLKEQCLQDVMKQLRARMPTIRVPHVVPVSAIRNKGLGELLNPIPAMFQTWHTKFATSKLNNSLKHILSKQSPPLAHGLPVTLKFMRQVRTAPPTFAVWGNRVSQVPDSYKYFFRNQLSEMLGLTAVPVHLIFKKNNNPYAKKTGKKPVKPKR